MENQETNDFGNPIRPKHNHKFETSINSLEGETTPRKILENMRAGIAPDYHQPIYDENPHLSQGKDFRSLDLIDIQNAKRDYAVELQSLKAKADREKEEYRAKKQAEKEAKEAELLEKLAKQQEVKNNQKQ